MVPKKSSKICVTPDPTAPSCRTTPCPIEMGCQTCVAGYVGELHACPAPAAAPWWGVDLPQRDHLIRALTDSGWPAQAGPHTEPTRHLLTSRRAQILDRLHRYDQLVDDLLADSEPWVLTTANRTRETRCTPLTGPST